MKLITLKTFDFSHKAHLLKSILESEETESYIFDENIVTANAMYSNSVGGIKLKIRKEDFEKACQALEGTEYEITMPVEADVSGESFAKHILSLIFSKEAIITIVFCIVIILFLYFKFLVRDSNY